MPISRLQMHANCGPNMVIKASSLGGHPVGWPVSHALTGRPNSIYSTRICPQAATNTADCAGWSPNHPVEQLGGDARPGSRGYDSLPVVTLAENGGAEHILQMNIKHGLDDYCLYHSIPVSQITHKIVRTCATSAPSSSRITSCSLSTCLLTLRRASRQRSIRAGFFSLFQMT